MATQATWAGLARHRSGFQGLDTGLDYSSTLLFMASIKHRESSNRMRSIMQAGVWTPLRAARVNTGTSHCLHCVAENADAEHL